MGNNINLNDMINKAKNNGVELGQGTIIKKEKVKERILKAAKESKVLIIRERP